MFKQVYVALQSWGRSPVALFPAEKATAIVPEGVSELKTSLVSANKNTASVSPEVIENVNTQIDESRNCTNSDETKSVSTQAESPSRMPTSSSHDSAEDNAASSETTPSSESKNQRNRGKSLSVNPLLYRKNASTHEYEYHQASIDEFILYLSEHRADRPIVNEYLKSLMHDELTELWCKIDAYPKGVNGFLHEKGRIYLDDERRMAHFEKSLTGLKLIVDQAWRLYNHERNILDIQTVEEKNQYLLNRCLRYAPNSLIQITRYEDQSYFIEFLKSPAFRSTRFPGMTEDLIIETPDDGECLPSIELAEQHHDYPFEFFQPTYNNEAHELPQAYYSAN